VRVPVPIALSITAQTRLASVRNSTYPGIRLFDL